MKTLFILLWSSAACAATLQLDNATTLLDGSLFTAGTLYKGVFQLNGGGPLGTATTFVENIALGAGTGFAPGLDDFAVGIYTIGPNPALPLAIWQAAGRFALTVNPGNVSSIISQNFQAGSLFAFDFEFLTNLPPGETPASFAFQIYDANVTTLLYDFAFDITASTVTPVPEPALAIPAALALAALAYRRRR